MGSQVEANTVELVGTDSLHGAQWLAVEVYVYMKKPTHKDSTSHLPSRYLLAVSLIRTHTWIVGFTCQNV